MKTEPCSFLLCLACHSSYSASILANTLLSKKVVTELDSQGLGPGGLEALNT